MYEGNFKRPDLIYHDKRNNILIVVKVGVYWFWEEGMINRGDLIEEAYYTYLLDKDCLLYTSPSPRDGLLSRMPSSA